MASDREEVRRAIQAEIARREEIREQCEDSLLEFVKLMWPVVEPARPLMLGWSIEAICEHLEAVHYGWIRRLLISVPPGFMKSLTSNVFFPAWEWGPRNYPSCRYIGASYSQSLTLRDNVRFRNVISSDIYKRFWGDIYGPSKDQFNLVKVANDKTGWKIASSTGGVGTGERGDRFVADDPNNVKEAESKRVLESTNQWFFEVVPTRLNDPADSAIIVIQQRTGEGDVTGSILDRDLNYVNLCIPMENDTRRHCATVLGLNDAGEEIKWEDPRTEEFELAWPERFPQAVVDDLKITLGPFAAAAQLQQSPEPRGGGIIKRDWWKSWPPEGWPEMSPKRTQWPPLEFVIASLDTAMTTEKHGDFSALQIWGVWRDPGHLQNQGPRLVIDDGQLLRIDDGMRPKAIMMWGWSKRLDLHGPPEPEEMKIAIGGCAVCGVSNYRKHKDDCLEFRRLREKTWGLVEWVVNDCRKFKVDRLIIEQQARGIDVANEIQRLYANEDWTTEIIPARGDKESRVYAVQHLFSAGLIYAPMPFDDKLKEWRYLSWTQSVIDEISVFPFGTHDDAVDAMTGSLLWLRQNGLLLRKEEADQAIEEEYRYKPKQRALYDV